VRIARFDGGRIGVVVGEDIVDVSAAAGVTPGEWPPVGPVRLIRDFDALRPAIEAAAATGAKLPLASVRLETPVPWPNNQGFFLKPNSSLSGPADPIVLPHVPGREVHHEAELGIIIGKTARGVAREDWKDYVFGYACLMDMVVRGREERVFRKAYDTFCPVGPWIVTADAVPDPQALEFKLWVVKPDGSRELRQHANTRDLVLDIPGMVATASAVMTLQPGDIIASGTPQGVGPIVAGDTVHIWIQDVGEMTVPVVQGTEGATEVFADTYVPPIVKQPLG